MTQPKDMASQSLGAQPSASQGAKWEDWRDRQIKRADQVHAAPFRDLVRTKYRSCRTAQELRDLAAYCWRERNYAVRQANRFSNFTRHGTHNYDAWDYLAADAESFAKQLEAKARAREAANV